MKKAFVEFEGDPFEGKCSAAIKVDGDRVVLVVSPVKVTSKKTSTKKENK